MSSLPPPPSSRPNVGMSVKTHNNPLSEEIVNNYFKALGESKVPNDDEVFHKGEVLV